ncbi:hypothetical protein [Celeribacter sp. SCSIO 80788]|uniref:hypothetical protein n=1 Tax=Celeribacter sp. SCSIO 80788 TaxID=3117013 RepID=UPI003DA48BC7
MRRTRLTRPALAASILLLATPALANGPQGGPQSGPQSGPQGQIMLYPQQQQMQHQQPQTHLRQQPAPHPVRVEKQSNSDLGDVLTALAAIGVLASVLD